MSSPLVIAHRGDSSRGLENSLAAVRLALTVPVDMIEIDVRKSRDNRLYLMHDKETGRTADRNIDIEQSEADAIAPVRLKNGDPVPMLADVLALVAGNAGLNIEIKSDGAGGLCAAQIAGAGYPGTVIFSSFKEREVLDARRIMPAASFAVIYDDFSEGAVNDYRNRGYGMISLKRQTVTERLVVACHDRKIKVLVWTVDEEEEMKKFVAWGVDGIYTNRPAALREIITTVKG
jgi:glycerophosphoryl diester phosphodiesterase